MRAKKSKLKYNNFNIEIVSEGKKHYVSIDKNGLVLQTFGDSHYDTISYAKKCAKHWIDSLQCGESN